MQCVRRLDKKREIWTHTQRRPCEDAGVDNTDVPTQQGAPGTASEHQKPGESGEGPLPDPSEGARGLELMFLPSSTYCQSERGHPAGQDGAQGRGEGTISQSCSVVHFGGSLVFRMASLSFLECGDAATPH